MLQHARPAEWFLPHQVGSVLQLWRATIAGAPRRRPAASRRWGTSACRRVESLARRLQVRAPARCTPAKGSGTYCSMLLAKLSAALPQLLSAASRWVTVTAPGLWLLEPPTRRHADQFVCMSVQRVSREGHQTRTMARWAGPLTMTRPARRFGPQIRRVRRARTLCSLSSARPESHHHARCSHLRTAQHSALPRAAHLAQHEVGRVPAWGHCELWMGGTCLSTHTSSCMPGEEPG
jgi:hypothetical protein